MNRYSIFLVGLALSFGTILSFANLPQTQATFHALYLPVALHIAYSDISKYRISVISILAAMLLGLLYNLPERLTEIWSFADIGIPMAQALISGAILAGFFVLVNLGYKAYRGITGIAPADILLFGVAAMWLPLSLYPTFLIVACVGAITLIFIRNLRRKRNVKSLGYVPFGAFQALSIWATALIHWQ